MVVGIFLLATLRDVPKQDLNTRDRPLCIAHRSFDAFQPADFPVFRSEGVCVVNFLSASHDLLIAQPKLLDVGLREDTGGMAVQNLFERLPMKF